MWAFGIGALSSGIFLLIFAQFTMRRIEKQIKLDQSLSYEPLDFGGSRIITYAHAIILPEHIALRMNRLIDVSLVRRYTNKTDWWRSFLFIITTDTWILFVLFCSIFGFI